MDPAAVSPSDILLVFCAFPDAGRARAAGRQAVAARLAACANVLPGVTSIYVWEGKQAEENESLALFKTTRGSYPALEAQLRAAHSYKLPEIIAVELAAGLPAYLRWVAGHAPAPEIA